MEDKETDTVSLPSLLTEEATFKGLICWKVERI